LSRSTSAADGTGLGYLPPPVGGVKTVKSVKLKKKCCKSDPRCKRCPVVWKRLEKQGIRDPTKKQLKAARAR
jgi:hypothetical protein